jgi:hypothetical protein
MTAMAVPTYRPGRRAVLMKSAALFSGVLVAPLAGRQPRLTLREDNGGGLEILEEGAPVLRYHYATVPVPESLHTGLSDSQAESMRRYGHPRSNYIHPLYGLDGVPLTADWAKDHPHHRGIYWAWPEVGYRGELGDLHALQRVFARPTGRLVPAPGDAAAAVEAENEWRWDDVTPIVRETTRIRAHARGPHGRLIDLQFSFTALVEGVTLARRQTELYGGLNLRLAPVSGLRLSHHADSPAASPRMAWQTAAGTWQGSASPSSLTILEWAGNPGYPADYVEYPDLPWFQPAFPRAGTRHTLVEGTPLMLRYRLWLREGPPPSEAACRLQWQAFQGE